MELIKLFATACENNGIFFTQRFGDQGMWKMAALFPRAYSSASVTAAIVSRSHVLCVASHG